MRKGLFLLATSCIALVAMPNTSEAFGWRTRLFVCRPACLVPQTCQRVPCCPTGSIPAVPCMPLPPNAQEKVAAKTVVIKGKSYTIIPHPDRGEQEEDERANMTDVLPPGAAGSNIPFSDRFNGTARRIAKTSIAVAPIEEFQSVAALLASLTPDTQMKGTIPSTPMTNRVETENHNVKVKAFIYAFKKETDNDYHIIIGDAVGTPNVKYFNTEISGIPIAGSDETRDKLTKVRNVFKTTFDLGADGPSSYFRPSSPVPVLLTGSLFWDVDHENSPVGPQDFKPKTTWEIHPIVDIEFLEP